MASRGVVNKVGEVTDKEYKIVEGSEFENSVVLEGLANNHSLPDYSHTPNRIYIKLSSDGILKEMRVYGEDKKAFIEIGYHPEKYLVTKSERNTKVLHYHKIDKDFNRSDAEIITKELYEKYKSILNKWGVYLDEDE